MASYKEEGCCTVNLLKYVLFIFNFIFFLGGCAVFGVGLWTILDKHDYAAVLPTDTYVSIAYLLLIAGIISIILGIIGCFAILMEQRVLLLIYTFVLLLIFLLEAVAGIMAYVYEDQVWHELRNNMNDTFLEYYKHDDSKTTAIDKLQLDFECCGAISFRDWAYSKWRKENPSEINLVPESCCLTPDTNCAYRTTPSNIHIRGCIDSFVEESLKPHLMILGAVGLGICLIQLIGMLFSCCLYLKL